MFESIDRSVGALQTMNTNGSFMFNKNNSDTPINSRGKYNSEKIPYTRKKSEKKSLKIPNEPQKKSPKNHRKIPY